MTVAARIFKKFMLYLHIGTEKTGSTALQSFLQLPSNQKIFQNYHVHIPTFLGLGNHVLLPISCYSPEKSDILSEVRGYGNSEPRKQLFDSISTKLSEYAGNYNEEKIVISSEHLQSRLTENEELLKLSGLLNSIFNDITIVLYIRNPLDTALSCLSESIKGGSTNSHLLHPKAYDQICNHKNTVQNWKNAFPHANFCIRKYDKKLLVRENILDDFMSLLDIHDLSEFNHPKKNTSNTKLTKMEQILLSQLNIDIPLTKNGAVNKERVNLVNFLHNYFKDTEPYSASLDSTKLFESYYESSDKWIRENFFRKSDVLWKYETNLQRNAKPSNLLKADDLEGIVTDSTFTQKLIEIIRDLWLQNR